MTADKKCFNGPILLQSWPQTIFFLIDEDVRDAKGVKVSTVQGPGELSAAGSEALHVA